MNNPQFATLQRIVSQEPLHPTQNIPIEVKMEQSPMIVSTDLETLCRKKTLEDICEYLMDQDIECGLFNQLIQNEYINPDELSQNYKKKRTLKYALQIINGIDPNCPQVESLGKISECVIQLFQEDSKSEILKPLPSLIGLTGMITLFYQYVSKKVQTQAMWDWLDLLLPALSQLPYLKTSRSCSEEAIDILSETEIPDNLTNPEEFLMRITSIHQIIARYPVIATLEHIKTQLEKYHQSLNPSLVQQLIYQYYAEPVKLPVGIYDNKIDDLSLTNKVNKKKNEKVNKPIRQPVDENGQIIKKKKRRFTEEETQNLIEGVQQFGIGHWKLILNNFKFDDRSCVDLKDKWRNLEFSRLRNNKQKSNEPTMAHPNNEQEKNTLPSVGNALIPPSLMSDGFKQLDLSQ
ncbi:hypothetical protein ENUP19_0089G0017 [Entamoeba nuttalli]|uniref:Myb family DNA-binding domain containing protein n=2 Tax=Entamoeba nuttalli TaxID=412467 RepID=K2H4C7_ENTNP|nr:Myb family DNA-binding domain containing protein [Entamoeba nuttalli P19]EKE37329.1 Myb family DNA-binding domain containing protein [Entamoeba nuttalli P19]|eukprot:XP_008860337.1 Myb family DNA-binding domain containing protein [Entamoeba nuttalli P19]